MTVLDSLFKQSIAVLATAILAAVVVSVLLIATFVLRPQLDRAAATTAEMAERLGESFAEMEPPQRQFLIDTLRGGAALNVIIAEDSPDTPIEQRGWFPRYFLHLLSERYGIPPENIVVDSDGLVWIHVDGGDPPLWFALRSVPITDPITGLLVACCVALLSALAGGVILQRRVARPLHQLKSRVGDMSSPTDFHDLDIAGPTEVAAVARALSQMLERLKAADADRAVMLAGVSHDLRTPLTKLRLSLAMLKGADPDLVQSATRQVQRIEVVLAQFLDFARGFEAEETKTVELATLLTNALSYCDAGDEVTLDCPDPIPVQVKEAALYRAIENLLTNAHRYGQPPVGLSGALNGSDLVIEITDAGDGMPLAETEALLRPFARGSIARDNQGTGLGLAIVDQVARSHGGTLEFDRAPNRFTARLRLPQGVGEA